MTVQKKALKRRKRRRKRTNKEKKQDAEEVAKKALEEQERSLYGDDLMFLDETKLFYQDFYSLFWNTWYKGNYRNLHLVVQVLQLKKNTVPSVNANISK